MPARIDSVTVTASSRLKLAVCSTTNLYLSATGSSTLCSALVAVDRRAGAGLALQVHDGGAVGEELHDQLALRLAALDVVGADMAEDARARRRPGGRW